MYYVYLLRSLSSPNNTYIGYTIHLKTRLNKHNAGGSLHTSKYVPWELITYFAFADEQKAIAFEKYLKSQAGRVFAAKRFW